MYARQDRSSQPDADPLDSDAVLDFDAKTDIESKIKDLEIRVKRPGKRKGEVLSDAKDEIEDNHPQKRVKSTRDESSFSPSNSSEMLFEFPSSSSSSEMLFEFPSSSSTNPFSQETSPAFQIKHRRNRRVGTPRECFSTCFKRHGCPAKKNIKDNKIFFQDFEFEIDIDSTEQAWVKCDGKKRPYSQITSDIETCSRSDNISVNTYCNILIDFLFGEKNNDYSRLNERFKKVLCELVVVILWGEIRRGSIAWLSAVAVLSSVKEGDIRLSAAFTGDEALFLGANKGGAMLLSREIKQTETNRKENLMSRYGEEEGEKYYQQGKDPRLEQQRSRAYSCIQKFLSATVNRARVTNVLDGKIKPWELMGVQVETPPRSSAASSNDSQRQPQCITTSSSDIAVILSSPDLSTVKKMVHKATEDSSSSSMNQESTAATQYNQQLVPFVEPATRFFSDSALANLPALTTLVKRFKQLRNIDKVARLNDQEFEDLLTSLVQSDARSDFSNFSKPIKAQYKSLVSLIKPELLLECYQFVNNWGCFDLL